MLTTTYAIYLVMVTLITIFVARTLSKNGAVFLLDGFGGDAALAQSINHMLVVGFYLINLGFALLQLDSHRNIETIDRALVFLSSKIGFVMVVVGVVHFFNLLVISKFKSIQFERQRAAERQAVLYQQALIGEASSSATQAQTQG